MLYAFNMAPALENLLVFALGVVMLLTGGEALVRGAIALAARLGVSTLFIGLTVVAFGTSAPELSLNLAAAVDGHTDLSFGNIVGSNIANIGLILGFSALCKPLLVHVSIVRRELPFMIAATTALVALALAPPGQGAVAAISRVDGALLLVGFSIFVWVMTRTLRRGADGVIAREAREIATKERGGMIVGVALTLVGLALLVAGGRLAESGAVGLATALGVSQSLIGLTIVAIATSLPELATSLIAIRKGHADIAVGNVVGSNIFNILLIMGLTALTRPVALPEGAWRSLAAVTFLSVALLPVTRTHNRMISRFEGAFLLGCYVVWLGFEAWLGGTHAG